MPDWIAVDIRHASLDKDRRTRAVAVSAETYPAAVSAAVRQLGLASAHRGFAFVQVVAEGEAVADAVVRVSRAAAEHRLRAEARGQAVQQTVIHRAGEGPGTKWDVT